MYGVQANGNFYFGAGCPQQVKDYIEEKLADLSLDEYDSIVSFLNNLEFGDKTLQELLNEKVDKEEGKSLIDEDFAARISYEEYPEFKKVTLDENDRIVEATRVDGTKLLPLGYEINNTVVKVENNPEFLAVWTINDRILLGFTLDGNVLFGCGIPRQIREHIENMEKDLSSITYFLEGFAEGANLLTYLNTTYGYYEENVEFVKLLLDDRGYIIKGIKQDGTEYIGINVETNSCVVSSVTSREFIILYTDSSKRILFGITYEGDVVFGCGVPSNIKMYVDEHIDNIKQLVNELGTYEDIKEYLTLYLDSNNFIVAGRKLDGTAVEKVGLETPKLDVDGNVIESANDVEHRTELKLDKDKRILKEINNEGVVIDYLKREFKDKVTLNEVDYKGKAEEYLENLINNLIIKAGFVPEKLHIPSYGTVNIKSETFYLTKDDRYSDKTGIYLIQDYPDTTENAKNKVTLSYFYIASTLINNGDGTYSKYNDGVEGHDVKLTFYAAGKVTKVSDAYYVTATLDSEGQPTIDSIEVTQITDVPPYKAWPVDKKTEHYCIVEIDFGYYLTNNNVVMGVKYQGSSTLNNRKRNFRFTFYKNNAKRYYPFGDDTFGKKDKIKIGKMVRLSGYNLKANFGDQSRIKELLIYAIILSIWEQRPIIDRYPWDKEFGYFTGAVGTIQGFPIHTMIGTEFYGMHVFSLKKDEKNYMLDGSDASGIFVCGNRRNPGCWTDAVPADWDEEMLDDMSESTADALRILFDFINNRLYKSAAGDEYLTSQTTTINNVVYVTDSLISATRTEDPAYTGSDGNLYILSELTDINGTLYVTDTLVEGEPTEDSVIATAVSGHNIYIGTDGERYLSTDLTTIDGVKYVTAKIITVSLIEFNEDTIPERMDVNGFIDYFICLQAFVMWDSTCRNMILHTRSDKKKFYPFFYDLDLCYRGGPDYHGDQPDADIFEEAYTMVDGQREYWDMSLWENIRDFYWDEIVNRWGVLRNTVLTEENIVNLYNKLTKDIPESDYVNENLRWHSLASKAAGENLLNIIENRFAWLDANYFIV